MNNTQLDMKTALQILVQHLNQANKSGSFTLPESSTIHRAILVLTKDVVDSDMDVLFATNLVLTAATKGQEKGSYNLDDSALIHKVCTFISEETQNKIKESAVVQDNTESSNSSPRIRTV